MCINPILKLVHQINKISKNAIKGAFCINPKICNGKCCYTSPDLPDVLVKYYLSHKLATEDDFIRSDLLNYRIRIDPSTKRCAFFVPYLNGCKLHQLQMKPPQCCLYPLHRDKINYSCRINQNFTIEQDFHTKLFHLFDIYLQRITDDSKSINRINENLMLLNNFFKKEISPISPQIFQGIQIKLSQIKIISSKLPNFNLLVFCDEIPCKNDFFSCNQICQPMWKKIHHFFAQKIRSQDSQIVFREKIFFSEASHKIKSFTS